MTGTRRKREIQTSVWIVQSPSLQERGRRASGSVFQDGRNPVSSRERNPPRPKDRRCWNREEDTDEDTWPAVGPHAGGDGGNGADEDRTPARVKGAHSVPRPGTGQNSPSVKKRTKLHLTAQLEIRRRRRRQQHPHCAPRPTRGLRTKPALERNSTHTDAKGDFCNWLAPDTNAGRLVFLTEGEKNRFILTLLLTAPVSATAGHMLRVTTISVLHGRPRNC